MKKNLGIIKVVALLLLFPIVVWELTLKKTYQLYKENKQMETEVMAIANTPPRSSAPVVSATSSLISNGKLLEMITDDSKEMKVEIVSYQPSLINEDDTYKLYAGTMVLRGDYINLVKTIDAVEKKHLPVKLSSAVFSYYIAKREDSDDAVELTLIFQQVEN